VPTPYLTGKSFFFDSELFIEKGVFIPQKSTEILVEKILFFAEKIWKNSDKLKVLEIGVGSGNSLVSLSGKKKE
jgi:release factor glutamine methyltransferase